MQEPKTPEPFPTARPSPRRIVVAALPAVVVASADREMCGYIRRCLGPLEESLGSAVEMTNGRSVLEFARRRRVGLVIADQVLPGLDGVALPSVSVHSSRRRGCWSWRTDSRVVGCARLASTIGSNGRSISGPSVGGSKDWWVYWDERMRTEAPKDNQEAGECEMSRAAQTQQRLDRTSMRIWSCACLLMLLVPPLQAADFALATPYNSNNGQRGAMFDVFATNTVTIRNIDANLYAGTTANYEIYYRAGTHVGHENNAAAWTFIGGTTGLTSLGIDVPTPIPIAIDVTIPAGQTYSFYVTNDFGGGTSYTDGTAVGDFLAGDANLAVYEGVGKSYPFGLTFLVRNFNGTLHYDLGGGIVSVTPTPASVTAPGGSVTYNVTVTNFETGTMALTGLTDSLLGSLDGQGTCALPQTLAQSTSYNCSFTTTVNGSAGTSVSRTVAATGTIGGNPFSDVGSASVDILGGSVGISLAKTASPTSIPEPSGSVTFTVRVDNTGTQSADVTSLTDDIHGNLDGQGTCALPQMIAVSGFYECSFTVTVSGNGGSSETDTVTAGGTSGGMNVSAQDSATVTVTDVAPTATVTKTALPTTVDEPGGNVTFSVTVSNTGTAESLDLTALVDDIHGDLNGQGTCSVPQTIATSGSYACSFTAAVNGNAGDSETDTVTATVSDDDGNTIMPSDSATVTITGVASSIAVTKTPAPTTVDEPGGNVTFTIRIDNTSPVDSVTISSLTDDVHGDLNGQGSCTVPQAIAVGGFYECSFTASVTGNAGDSETDTVTASGTDDDGDPVSGQDSATVTVIDVAPTATVTKTALPTSVDEPGGNVTFSVTVANTGTAESLELTALVDDIHGDLNGQGSCSVPQTIATSGSYACSFTAAVKRQRRR